MVKVDPKPRQVPKSLEALVEYFLPSAQKFLDYWGLAVDRTVLFKCYCDDDEFPRRVKLTTLLGAFRQFGIEYSALRILPDAIDKLVFPAILLVDQNFPVFVLERSSSGKLVWLDVQGRILEGDLLDIQRHFSTWDGKVVIFRLVEERKVGEVNEVVKDALEFRDGVRILRNALSESECVKLIQLATGKMELSKMRTLDTGKSFVDPAYRSSKSAYLSDDETTLLIKRRFAQLAGVSIAQMEKIQVVSYSQGQQFSLHTDTGNDEKFKRAITILMYLSDDFLGGHTQFPLVNLSIKPMAGTAVIFRNLRHDGKLNCWSLHAGAAVSNGTKFVANLWIRESA